MRGRGGVRVLESRHRTRGEKGGEEGVGRTYDKASDV